MTKKALLGFLALFAPGLPGLTLLGLGRRLRLALFGLTGCLLGLLLLLV